VQHRRCALHSRGAKVHRASNTGVSWWRRRTRGACCRSPLSCRPLKCAVCTGPRVLIVSVGTERQAAGQASHACGEQLNTDRAAHSGGAAMRAHCGMPAHAHRTHLGLVVARKTRVAVTRARRARCQTAASARRRRPRAAPGLERWTATRSRTVVAAPPCFP
jgi:hypothetical protein